MGYVNEAFDAETLVEAARARWRSATSATRRPARASWPTRSRSSSTACTASSPSATTATWSTPASCATRSSAQGAIFQTSSDTEVVVHLFARSREDGAEAAIVDADVAGARRLLVRDDDQGPADRRPRSARVPAAGDRPARRRLGDLLRDLRARSDRRDLRARRRARRGRRRRARTGLQVDQAVRARRRTSQCVFEHVYFARPDSYVFGESVNEVRTELGRRLARESAGRRRRRRADSRLRRVRRGRVMPKRRASRCAWG